MAKWAINSTLPSSFIPSSCLHQKTLCSSSSPELSRPKMVVNMTWLVFSPLFYWFPFFWLSISKFDRDREGELNWRTSYAPWLIEEVVFFFPRERLEVKKNRSRRQRAHSPCHSGETSAAKLGTATILLKLIKRVKGASLQSKNDKNRFAMAGVQSSALF